MKAITVNESDLIQITKMKKRAVRRYRQGCCIVCGKPRENPDNSMWCNFHLEEERKSHTSRLSQN